MTGTIVDFLAAYLLGVMTGEVLLLVLLRRYLEMEKWIQKQ
jgi:hypothetical protein